MPSPVYARFFKLALPCLMVMTLAACQSATTRTAGEDSRPSTSLSTGETKVDRAIERALAQAEREGNKQESLVLLENIYNRNKTNPEVAVRYSRALREDEQMNRARLVLQPHTGKKDPYQPALTEMSMIHLGLGQYKEAEKFSRRASTLDEKDGRAFLALGTALDAQGLHQEAEEAFRTGLDEWKGDPAPILNNLALNLAAQGKVPEALKVLEKARDLSPRRMEIERNYRIISTLNETVGPRVPKPPPKPAALQDKEARVTPAEDPVKTATMTAPEEREPITTIEPASGVEQEPEQLTPRPPPDVEIAQDSSAPEKTKEDEKSFKSFNFGNE